MGKAKRSTKVHWTVEHNHLSAGSQVIATTVVSGTADSSVEGAALAMHALSTLKGEDTPGQIAPDKVTDASGTAPARRGARAPGAGHGAREADLTK